MRQWLRSGQAGATGVLVAVVSLTAAVALAACAGAGSPPPTAPMEETPMGSGWTVLFDGSSTAALRGYGTNSLPTSWVVEDGALHAIPGAGIDLISRDTWADFEIEFEWRVAPGGNSGVIYRVVETNSPSWASGPEYQILDDVEHPDGRDPLTSAAALYGLVAPAADKHLEPVGSYNSGRIAVRDGHVEHWLNGRQVLGYEWGGADVRSRIAASKFRDLAGFMRANSGHVVIQHHGEEVWFRDIRIRPLDRP